jgi:hypothetical protein
VSVTRFYNPELVSQLQACGITRQRVAPNTPTAGFVLEGRRAPARSREALTNVIAVRSNVTITGPRELTSRPAPPALSATTSTAPQTALELVDENARLRRDNQRLTAENERLRGEVARLIAGPHAPPSRDQDLDDAATRFRLLELD